MKKQSTKLDVVSPDGFPIHPSDVYSSEKEAMEAFKNWKKGYERQGYYSSVKYGRLPLTELKNYIKIVKISSK